MSPSDDAADRVLVLTPFGRDADMVRQRLVRADIACEVCDDVDALLASVSAPAGAVLVAEEALIHGGAEALLAALDAQEPWSDLPMLLLTNVASRSRADAIAAMFERANVTLLERPVRMQLLVSSLRSAIRARRRQYQTRDLLSDLQRAVQLSDMFVSILGHDLRTPLGAITLAAEIIVRLPDSRALRPAGRILSSADRMTRMIEQLLDLARVRQGHGIPIDVRTVSFGEVCRTVVQELEDAHPQAYIPVRDRGDLVGEWDPDRLAQMVSNLGANAIQHGVGTAPVEVDLDGTMPDSVRMRIHNQGSVPAAVLPSLFEAFKGPEAGAPMARASRTGLGLGLFSAREIVRAHGGEIEICSSESDGTTVEVVLPRRRPVSAP